MYLVSLAKHGSTAKLTDGLHEESAVSKSEKKERERQKGKGEKESFLPTPKSSVALNSSVPASRLTSVAAVLKASSIPACTKTVSWVLNKIKFIEEKNNHPEIKRILRELLKLFAILYYLLLWSEECYTLVLSEVLPPL